MGRPADLRGRCDSVGRVALPLPPAFSSRPRAIQVALVVLGPTLFGGACGVLLGISEPAYVIGTLLGIPGGLLAGLDHRRAIAGLGRGLAGGFLFGASLLLAHAATGARPMAELPEPRIVLVVVTTVIGAALGALGAAIAGRAERRREPPS